MKYVVKHHSDLTVEEIYAILELRNKVYIVELKCPVGDVDGEDLKDGTTHLMGYEGDTLAAYLRIHPTDDRAKVRRVVVAPQFRGRGAACALMQSAIAWARENNIGVIEIAARAHLQKFYESLGFVALGDQYFLESVQVWHVDMKLQIY